MKAYKMVVLMSVLLLAACGTESKDQSIKETNDEISGKTATYYNYLDEINANDIERVGAEASYAFDISNVELLKNEHTNVFIGRIDSMDGCSSTIGMNSFSSLPKTYGNVMVLSDLKGALKGQTIQYARPGGVISLADYEKDMPEDMLRNNAKHRKEAGQENIDKENTYLEFIIEQDIKLEVGKTYLFFGSFYDSGVFSINGVQYGAREVKQNSTGISTFSSMPKVEDVSVINNDTGEYESLAKIIETYFK